LTIIVNTSDDFEHFGLAICPDIDTVIYTLAGLAHPTQGWGRDKESFAALDTIERLGGESWFRLGDKDIGMHLMRRKLLDDGLSLSDVTARIAQRLGIAHKVAPMTDDTVSTMLDTVAGPISFQHYFVRERCGPIVHGIRYSGADSARPSPTFAQALADPDISGIIICPSNPYLSIDPILALPGVRRMLADTSAPVVAVAPLVNGEAIKGPTAKIMRELAVEASATTVARHYADFLDGYVINTTDRTAALKATVMSCDIIMRTLADKIALARRCITFAEELARRS
jgi:LPPG:FO 2-phospho-L-lactate transferase